VNIVYNGRELFFGTPAELAALSYNSTGLAGEHSMVDSDGGRFGSDGAGEFGQGAGDSVGTVGPVPRS
jgi:hypothetical protein